MILKKLTDFKLNAFYPYVPELHRSVETGAVLSGILPWIDAKVPGSVYRDLLNAGILRDPYYEMQSHEAEWAADRWWMYVTDFALEPSAPHRYRRIRLCGIDYKGHISFNGQKLGVHEGMYTPFVADITGLCKDGNHLSVTLESAPDETGQIGYTDRIFTQKARFTYKWDWCPRLVQLGLYDEIRVEESGICAFDYAHIRPVKTENGWNLSCSFDVYAFEAGKVTLDCALADTGKTLEFTLAEGRNTISLEFDAGSRELWYPNGHGKQPLYAFRAVMTDDNGVSDIYDCEVGFRTLSYIRCDGCSDDSLPYNVLVNGKRIYIKGVNLTPLDVMYGDIPDCRYQAVLEKARDANINLVRVWGGGLIEREIFYKLCDRYGIMVWQEFIQSSSGISNVPSELPEFLRLAAATAAEAVKVKRNHVSLTYWSGGNELAKPDTFPVGYENKNIAMLMEIANRLDPDRLMLPTSASGPLEFLDINKKGQNHDVHGPWKYSGPEGQYAVFNGSDSQLHSEFGVDGMGNYGTVCSVLSPANRKVTSMDKNAVWRHHGEWWDTFYRDSEIFGPFDENDLETFIACSQYIQAEGLRYALEANRRRAFGNCGSIIWQFNEPWPNVSGTNLLDYYNTPKLAYFFVKDAFRPVSATLRYDRLLWNGGETFRGTVYVLNEAEAFRDMLTVAVKDEDGNEIFRGHMKADAPENGAVNCGSFTCTVPDSRSYIISLESQDRPGMNSGYLFFVRDAEGHASKQSVLKYLKYRHNNNKPYF